MGLTNVNCKGPGKLVPSDVISYNTSNPRPAVGKLDRLYIDLDTGTAYYWDGAYIAFTGGSDKSYIEVYSGTIQNIAHNLGKYPAVTFIGVTGNEEIAQVVHDDVNNLTVSTNEFADGIITCN